MGRSYSIAEAKNRLPQLVHDAEELGIVELTRRGKPVAVIISCNELERLRGPKKTMADAIRKLRNRPDAAEIGLTDDEIASWRDRSPGRDFTFE